MLTITESVPAFETYEAFLGYRREDCLFFDIETTGLSSASSAVFLIGAVCYMPGTDSVWQLTQWIAQRPEDEPAVVQSFLSVAEKRDTLIHFNGSSFDLPFLRERAEKYHLTQNLSEKKSLDLYQIFRSLKKPLSLVRMNQTTLEQFLGWQRRDRLTGRQMLSLFSKYAASQEGSLCDLLLLHNHDDLLGMTALLRLSAYAMLFTGEIGPVSATVAESGQAGIPPFCADSLRNTGTPDAQKFLLVRISLKAELPQSISLSRNLWHNSNLQSTAEQHAQESPNPEIRLYAAGTEAVLLIPGFCGELRHFFHDYRNYCYLPLEDQAIHKSVAAFVDREYRMPATPSNCYIKKSGVFFPQTKECISPAFKPSFASRELYFSCEDSDILSLSGAEQLNTYAASLLSLFLK